MPQENELEPNSFLNWPSPDDLLLQEIIHAEHVAEQQLWPGNLLTNPPLQLVAQQPNNRTSAVNPPQPVNAVLHAFHVPDPQVYLGNAAEIKDEDFSATPSPLIHPEESVNLNAFREIIDNNESPSPNNQWVGEALCFAPNLNSWPGSLNFRISIPPPKLEGVKPKWCYSYLLDKLYVAKLIAFPVCLTLDAYPEGASLVICPVFNKSESRMTPVPRCPNCQTTDSNPAVSEHVVQVEGTHSTYFIKEDRYVVAVPLGSPAPGDTCVNLFLKVACNTSCVGGPNRRPFSILLSLKLNEREIGRQVLNIRCCEGPDRDRLKEEKTYVKSHPEVQQDPYITEVRRVANEIAISSRKTSKKRKKSNTSSDCTELVSVSVPKHYEKKVKKYINYLYMKEQLGENKKLKKFYQSESDSD